MSSPPKRSVEQAPGIMSTVHMNAGSQPQVTRAEGSARLSRSSWSRRGRPSEVKDDTDSSAASSATSRTQSPVKETHHINIDYNPLSGRKQLNKYEIFRELGRGQHGKVKLGRDMETGQFVAIKTVDRKDRPRLGRPQGRSTEEKIRREIAILKKCNHPNIVGLIEVLDDETSRKIYLVLEYLEKGEVKWQNQDGSPTMTRDAARQAARDTLLGLEYLHCNDIIHRDIKPANLLLSKDNVVKISDFGVSYAATGDGADTDLELAKTVGTPSFFAPEMCVVDELGGKRHISNKIDIWAFGVTLFCLLYGYLPFEADNEYELFRVIATQPLELPDPKGDSDLEMANDLLEKLLDKNPASRISIAEIKEHPWLANGMSKQQMEKFLAQDKEQPIQVSDKEVSQAVRGITGRLRLGLSRLADHIRSRSRSRSNSEQTLYRSKPPRLSESRPSDRLSLASHSASTTDAHARDVREVQDKAAAVADKTVAGAAAAMAASGATGSAGSATTGPATTGSATTGSATGSAGSAAAASAGTHSPIYAHESAVASTDSENSNSLSQGSAEPLQHPPHPPHPYQHRLSTISTTTSDGRDVERVPQPLELSRDTFEPLWASDASSSSDSDDNGELTLVLGRNRATSSSTKSHRDYTPQATPKDH